jgi:hypothetical protein
MTYPVPTNAGAQSFLGYTSADNPVADRDDLYLSAEGITYRHFTAGRGVAAGVQFWDEVLVATSDPTLIDAAAVVGGRSPAGNYPS